MRVLDLDSQTEYLVIQFPYDRKLVDLVRTLPRRRFDHQQKIWTVPKNYLDEVVAKLYPHHFIFGARLQDYVAQSGLNMASIVQNIEAKKPKPLIDHARLPDGTWTVDKLNYGLRDIIRETWRESVWVAAEIQSYDRNQKTGHAFFELVHRHAINADPAARITAVLWKSDRINLEAALSKDGGQVRLRDGLLVRVLVKVDFYTGQGRLQLVIQDIDLAYTTGTIHQRQAHIYAMLEKRQIATLNLEKTLAPCPLNIGLITSDGSDAYADFMHELKISGYGFKIAFCPARVQGAHTEESILKALKYFEQHAGKYDAVVIIRGGGARSDLAYFDTEALGEAVCKHPLKIIVGIGHQRDRCLLDLIAYSEKTPTAAGRYLVEVVKGALEQQDILKEKLYESVTEFFNQAQHKVDHLSIIFSSKGHLRLQSESQRLEKYRHRYVHQATLSVQRAKFVLLKKSQSLKHRAQDTLNISERRLEALKQYRFKKLDQTLTQHYLNDLKQKETQLKSLDPKRILERGFAIVRRKDGKIVRSVSDIDVGEMMQIDVERGQLIAVRTSDKEE